MSTFVWSDSGDAGANTWRWCIDQVNAAGAGPHTIDCQLSTGTTVNLLSHVSVVSQSFTVTGIATYGDVTLNYASSGSGNGLRISGGVTVTVENLKFDGGSTASNLTFVYANASSLFSFTGCGFVNNKAGNAVAAMLITEVENVNGTFEDCIFTDVANTSFDRFFLRADGTPTVKGHIQFINCTGTRCGTSKSNSSDITFDGGVWDGGFAYANFRHVYADGTTATNIKIHNTEVTRYCAQNGAAGRVDKAPNLDIFNSKVHNNVADTNFGGAYMITGYYGIFKVDQSVFENNSSVWTGGAIHFSLSTPAVSPLITNTLFKGNSSSTQDGGAIHWSGTLVTDLVSVQYNVTYEANTAVRWGGAERVSFTGSGQRTKRYFNTYIDNVSNDGTGGGALRNSSGDSRVHSSVFVRNLENGSPMDIRVTGGSMNGSNNLLTASVGSSIGDGLYDNKVGAGYNFDVDLSADNGGPWPTCKMYETCDGYLHGAQADVDANSIEFDARGDPYVRVYVATTPCAGAFEIQPDPLSVVYAQVICF